MDGIGFAECLVSETQDTKDEASSDHCSCNGTTFAAVFNLWAHGRVALADSVLVVPGISGLLWDVHKVEVLWWSRRSRGGGRSVNCGVLGSSSGGTVLVCGAGVAASVSIGSAGAGIGSAGASSAVTARGCRGT